MLLFVLAGLSGCGDANDHATGANANSGIPTGDNLSSSSSSSSSSGATSSSSGSSSSSSSSSSSGGTTALVTVNAGTPIAQIYTNQLGTNLAAWYDITQPGVASAIASTGARLFRWPGGSTSDQYHWSTQATCGGAYVNPNSTFSHFIDDVVTPDSAQVVLTINYGSNAACNGGGDPKEAAAWVANVVSNGYNVHHYTVGNEVYGSWEYDLHSSPHDPSTYAAAVGTATSGGFYQLMKAQDPSAQIGVVVEDASSWDSIVLGKAKYDYVELHEYLQAPGGESDSFLLTQAAAQVTADINSLRSELASAGMRDTPIMMGEFNSVYSNPGKQSLSIVNGLFAGMVFGELLNDGVQLQTWFMGIGGGCTGGADSSSLTANLYGWQNFGSYDQVSEGWSAGSCASGSHAVPFGTVMPTGYAEQFAAAFALAGNNMLSVSVSSSVAAVRAYAASQGTGFAVLLFNLNESSATTLTVGVANTTRSGFTASTMLYGKAQYDQSQNGVWASPVSQSLGAVNGPVSVTLPPWSMTLLQLR